MTFSRGGRSTPRSIARSKSNIRIPSFLYIIIHIGKIRILLHGTAGTWTSGPGSRTFCILQVALLFGHRHSAVPHNRPLNIENKKVMRGN